MKIYLVRHGETEWNKKGLLQGREDIPLNDHGREQAKVLAEFFKDKPIDLIISSPLVRAHETAKIISNTAGAEIVTDDKLIEKDYGKATGMGKAERDRLFPRRKYDGMEKWSDLIGRTSSVLEAFSKNNDQKNLLFVCHSSVIKSMIQYVTGAPEEDKDIYGVTMSSIGVTEIEYNENTGYDLKYANREVI
ncbi:MAG: histidine phosphatase family protein [Butyrivibrio sp.]|nr:histidine phosphatase family protein [Butyrivibrio sp.]